MSFVVGLPEGVRHRRECLEREVTAALVALDGAPHRVRASDWPGDLVDLSVPGLYAWWVDEAGASDLSAGIGATVESGRIYAGQTGATKWPSGKRGKATLASRIGSNHLSGRIRGSTFRFTLAAALSGSLALVPSGPKTLEPAGEQRLSNWIRNHLSVAVHRFPDADRLGDLESRVLRVLDPPLNINGLGPSPVRAALSGLRRQLTAANH